MLNFIIGLIIFILFMRFLIFMVGLALNLVWYLLLAVVCVFIIVFLVKNITDMMKK